MPFNFFKKTAPEDAPVKNAEYYEKLGRQLESLYDAINPKRSVVYRTALLRGVFTGVGGVIGATLVVALLLWILSLFNELPFIGGVTESIQQTIDQSE